MTVSIGLGLTALSFVVGVGAAILGVFMRQLGSVVKRTGLLEQDRAAQAECIRGLRETMGRVEQKLDRALDRAYRGELPSQADV